MIDEYGLPLKSDSRTSGSMEYCMMPLRGSNSPPARTRRFPPPARWFSSRRFAARSTTETFGVGTPHGESRPACPSAPAGLRPPARRGAPSSWESWTAPRLVRASDLLCGRSSRMCWSFRYREWMVVIQPSFDAELFRAALLAIGARQFSWLHDAFEMI